MRKLIYVIVLALLVAATCLTPTLRTVRAFGCTSTSSGSVKGNCVVNTWTVCCEGPGAGEVSCFTYDEIVYCAPIIL